MKKAIAAAMLSMALLMSGCSQKESAEQNGSEPEASAETVQTVITNPVDLVVLEEHPDMSGYQWIEPGDHPFRRISLQESIRMFAEGGSGIVYYGRVNCPWCQRAVPSLDEAAREKGITIWYVDVDSEFMDNEDKIPFASQEGRQVYDELVSYIVSTFTEKDENGNPSFQIPLVISVKNGVIQGSHLSLLDSYTITDPNEPMDEENTEALKELYEDLIDKAAD